MLVVVAASTLDYVANELRLGGPAYYIGIAMLHLNSRILLVTTRSSVSNFLKKHGDVLDLLNVVEAGTGETVFRIDISDDNRSLKLVRRSKFEIERVLEVVKNFSAILVSTTYSELNIEELAELARERIAVVDVQGFIRKVAESGEVVHDTVRVFELGKYLKTSKRAILRGERSEFPAECWVNPLRCAEELEADLVVTDGKMPFKVVSYRDKCLYEVKPLQSVCGKSIGSGDVFTGALAHYIVNGNIELLEAAATASVAASLRLRDKYPWFTLRELEVLRSKVRVLREICYA
ncbi:MAG: hypothetical protein N3G79_00035 [Sulfolobales archaeon]|nr:hypothetical protein [Sulfolobales archaeon]